MEAGVTGPHQVESAFQKKKNSFSNERIIDSDGCSHSTSDHVLKSVVLERMSLLSFCIFRRPLNKSHNVLVRLSVPPDFPHINNMKRHSLQGERESNGA